MTNRIIRVFLLVGFSFGLFAFAGLAQGACPAGDLNEDCIVEFDDFLMFADQWLCGAGFSADLVGNDGVNFADYAVLFGNWLVEGCPLVINEFMASNDTTYADGQGEYDDWIEIYNPSGNAIDVGGMYITDDLGDLTKYRIPEGFSAQTTIMPNSYLLLWADEDVSDGPLHLDFKLSADGEEIGLFDNDGAGLVDSVVFDNQTTDISFGRTANGGEQWHTLTASPNASNNGKILYLVESPAFSVSSKAFAANFALSLSVDDPAATIRYTTDNSDPSPTHGSIYASPINIVETSVIKAIAYKAGAVESEIVAGRYIKLASDVAGFSSDIPIVLIDNYGVGDVPAEPKQDAVMMIFEPDGDRTSFADEQAIDCRIGIERRGASTLNQPKSHYGVEVRDEQGEDKNISPLGMPAESDWILHAPSGPDRTLMRNAFIYELSNRIGRYAVRTRFVEVFVNKYNGEVSYSDYVGVYVLMEKIKRSPDRVDVTKMEISDDTEPEISGGHILRKDRATEGEDSTFRTTKATLINEYPKLGAITPVQKNWIESYVENFESRLYGSNSADPVLGYRPKFDVGAAVDYNILNMYSKNADALRLSVFMYKDRGGKLMMGPIWDFNLSMGSYDWRVENPEEWNALGDAADYFGYSMWWDQLFQDIDFRLSYADRWFHLREDLFTMANINSIIDGMADELEEAQVRNFARWGIPTTYGGWEGEVDHLKDWLSQRAVWIDEQMPIDFAPIPPTIVFNRNDSNINNAGPVGSSVTFYHPTLGTGAIYYTLDGTDPRTPLGSASGVDTTILVSESAAKSVLVPTSSDDTLVSNGIWRYSTFNDSQWTHGSGGVGYERSTSGTTYTSLISIDVHDEMYNINKSCLIRIPFNVVNAGGIQQLLLDVRYDDGFIAYLNGNKVQEVRFDNSQPPAWNSGASGTHDDSQAVQFETFDLSAHIDKLVLGENILSFHALNASTTSSDFLLSAQLKETRLSSSNPTTPSAILYTAKVVLDKSTQFNVRTLYNGIWTTMNEAVFTIGPVADNLRITEIMYNPAVDPNSEFIELENTGQESINLNLVKFTNGIDFTFPDVDLAPDQHVLVVKDTTAFYAQHPTFSGDIAGEYLGNLDNNGEKVRLEDAIGTIIHDFSYKDSWYDITDGDGFSLTIKDACATDPNLWDDKAGWRPSAAVKGSPGTDDTGIVAEIGSVVINEILAHSDVWPNDWIELHNTTGSPINIGNWYLSDNSSDKAKYKIPEGTWIAADGYCVFTQDAHFGGAFALSENGETVYLTSGDGTQITGYSEEEEFGASQPNVAFGRYPKSTGTFNFVAMSSNTPGASYEGAPNAYPKVGPIVINEIMYHPADVDGNAEYIELLNISGGPVTLYDSAIGEPWKMTSAIEYTFPSGTPTTIPAGSYFLLIKDLAAFTDEYGAPVCPYVIWTDGSLSNGGEKVEISMPGDVDELLERQYIRIDRVNYSDGSHPVGDDPWFTDPDGGGSSLSRTTSTNYGNDVANWQAATPTPGM